MGKNVLKELKGAAARNKYRFLLISSVSDNFDKIKELPYVILLGTDCEWLKNTVRFLKDNHISSILLHKPNDINENDYFCSITISESAIINNALAYLSDSGKVKPALFGIQKDDVSDMQKMLTYLEGGQGTKDDVYPYDGKIETCFFAFYDNIARYDSVICTNDLFAVYLVKELAARNIKMPEHITVVGNGGIALSGYVNASFVTYCYDRFESEKAIAHIIRFLFEMPMLEKVDVSMYEGVITRVENSLVKPLPSRYRSIAEAAFNDTGMYADDPVMRRICRLNDTLTECDETNIAILSLLNKETDYHTISEKMILSEDTLKSRIRKLYRSLGIHNRAQLVRLFSEFRLTL